MSLGAVKRIQRDFSPSEVLDLYQQNRSTAFEALTVGKPDELGRLPDNGRWRVKAQHLAATQTIRQVGQPAWDRYRESIRAGSTKPANRRDRRLAREIASTKPGDPMDASAMLLGPITPR